jgi:predicted phosphohydrolase
LELSLKSLGALRTDAAAHSLNAGTAGGLIAALHFPPVNSKGVFSDFLDIMQRYKVSQCIYGHLHGEAHKKAFEGFINGIEFKFVAADYLGFKPLKLA